MLNGDMYSCNSGVSYEDAVVAFLNEHGFQAHKTGKSDGGIDIVAVSITKPQSYTFNIQCKYYNKPLGKAPIQEVYSGTQYYGNGGKPVVVTNNRMTADARVYAKRLGVEVIAEAEWKEIMQVSDTRKIINPNPHKGLMGRLIDNSKGQRYDGEAKCIFESDSRDECESFGTWIYSKFTRFFLVPNISKLNNIQTNHCFRFVPAPPSGKFDHIYTDAELYKAFNLPQKYIDVIEAVIKERK